jgi:hypothetical protein
LKIFLFSFQLKIISDDKEIGQNNAIRDVTLTDFYIIVIDDVDKVKI